MTPQDTPVAATLNVNFQPGSAQGEFAISNFASYVGQGYAALKLVDGLSTGTLQLFADIGTVAYYSTSAEDVNAKIEIIQNVSKIDAPYGETITVLWAISSAGVEVVPQLKSRAGGYDLNMTISGLIKRSSYSRPFKILRYEPRITSLSSGASLVQYGVVAAVKGGRVTMVEVQPISTDDTTIEAYRIVSDVLVNEEGEWEMPTGWPDSPTYPNGVKPTPNPGNGVIVERVHEICHITSNVTSYVRTYPFNAGKPYTTSSTFKPVKRLKEGGTTGMTKDQILRRGEVISQRKLFEL